MIEPDWPQGGPRQEAPEETERVGTTIMPQPAYLPLMVLELHAKQVAVAWGLPQMPFRGMSLAWDAVYGEPAKGLELLWHGRWVKLPAELDPMPEPTEVGQLFAVLVRNSSRDFVRCWLVAHGTIISEPSKGSVAVGARD